MSSGFGWTGPSFLYCCVLYSLTPALGTIYFIEVMHWFIWCKFRNFILYKVVFVNLFLSKLKLLVFLIMFLFLTFALHILNLLLKILINLMLLDGKLLLYLMISRFYPWIHWRFFLPFSNVPLQRVFPKSKRFALVLVQELVLSWLFFVG